MIDWLKKYFPYILISALGLKFILIRDYGIGAGIIIAGCLGYYYGVDKRKLKH